jgi:type II secretory pathway pseudopilin PulG
MNRSIHTLVPPQRIALLAAALIAAAPAIAAPTSEQQQLQALQSQLAQVQAALQQLTAENQALRTHEREIDAKLAQLAANVPATTTATVAQATPAGSAPTAPSPQNASALPAGSALPTSSVPVNTSFGSLSPNLRLWGYGEVYYVNPVNDRSQTIMDLARAVFGIGYKFDDRTEFNSEYEVEHAVSSASDVGEFEVEQFYVDRRLNDYVAARAGLFLMPFGFLNEQHEPTNFYGVQRNFVETLIIPSTWREGGFGLHGDTSSGFGWNVGLTTGFDLSKWEFQPEFPPYTSALELEDSNIAPLQATHQELALANARHLSSYVALAYNGVPGLTLGAAISTGKAVPAGPGDPRVTLWEAHARWQPARWDLSAIYARGTISDTAEVNALNPGSPNPIPSSFYGYYLQGAYRLWEHGDYRLAPFARFERYNLGASFAGTPGPDIPSGLVPLSPTPGDLGFWPVDHDRVWTVGANFYIGPHLVLKTDYQWFEENVNFKRWDLGLGVAF